MPPKNEQSPKRLPKEILREDSGVLSRLRADLDLAPKGSPSRERYEGAITRTIGAMSDALTPFAVVLIDEPRLTSLRSSLLAAPQDESTKRHARTRIKRGFMEPGPLNAIDLIKEFGPDIKGTSEPVDQAYQLLVDIGEIELDHETPTREISSKKRLVAGPLDIVRFTNEEPPRGLDAGEVATRLRELDDEEIVELKSNGLTNLQIAEELEIPPDRI